MDKDRRVSIETISAQFDVSVGTVLTIIREEYAEDLQKVCPKGAHPCHRQFDQDRHQDSSSPSL